MPARCFCCAVRPLETTARPTLCSAALAAAVRFFLPCHCLPMAARCLSRGWTAGDDCPQCFVRQCWRDEHHAIVNPVPRSDNAREKPVLRGSTARGVCHPHAFLRNASGCCALVPHVPLFPNGREMPIARLVRRSRRPPQVVFTNAAGMRFIPFWFHGRELPR
jgi:hypothetical protein